MAPFRLKILGACPEASDQSTRAYHIFLYDRLDKIPFDRIATFFEMSLK